MWEPQSLPVLCGQLNPGTNISSQAEKMESLISTQLNERLFVIVNINFLLKISNVLIVIF